MYNPRIPVYLLWWRRSVVLRATVRRIPGFQKEILKFFRECKSLYIQLLHDMFPELRESALDNDGSQQYYTIEDVLF